MKYAPCFDCPDRHSKCHADCERYAECRRQNEEIKKSRALPAADQLRKSHVIECRRKTEKYKQRGRR